jgi:lipoyl(octanoyl) transferase|tara:strand:+ start:261 stop:872 length:612 start_codon:yes stop_codon:yes gene_type:complete
VIKDLNFRNLGLIDYDYALDLMKKHIQDKEFKNEIWFLEHNPVFTLGTAADKSHILDAGSIPIFQSDRGGEVTYHGPGQLIIYFLLDIKQLNLGPKSLVKTLQKFIQSLLEQYSIDSNIVDGAPGVYVAEKKIASIGLRFSKGKSYHGVSINVDMDLSPFLKINPCGYENLSMTQVTEFYKDITIKQLMQEATSLIKDFYISK